MRKIKYFMFIIIAFSAFGLILASCGGSKAVDKEMMDANTALDELIQAGGTEEEVAEVQALIDEAKRLLAEGDTQGARKKLEEARFRAIELKGQHELESRDPDRMVPEMGEEIDIGLVDVFFDYDQSRVRSDAAPVLKQNATVISSNADRIKVVVVEGYCDTRGTDEYNLALGDQRAKSVISYLAGLGVNANILESVSKGETDEWAEGTSESAYQQNRRGHFRVIAR
jgi:peptidoglycan-associated lipoprotein